MLRRLTASALFGVALLALTATGQPPAVEKKPPEKKADPLDGLIAAALANDPDVRIARAKAQLADAEVAKARQLVTQRVLALNAGVEEQRRAIAPAAELVKVYENQLQLTTRAFKAGQAAQADVINVQVQLTGALEKLESAKAKLAQYEAELKLITGGERSAVGSALDPNDAAARAALEWFQLRQRPGGGDLSNPDFFIQALNAAGGRPAAPTGPIPDRLRAALDKKLKLGANGEKVTFEQALAMFKQDAGLDVPVRAEFKVGPVVSLGEELPVGAWLQLFADGTPDIRVLVREYGLLVTGKAVAPPDAVSVFDFWKQRPPVKEEPPKE